MNVGDEIFVNPKINPEAFNQAIRRLAGGVSIVTVGFGADRSGLAVKWVTTLDNDPRRLLLTIERNQSVSQRISDYRSFGVNILSAEQQDLADRFAERTTNSEPARFFGAPWKTLVTGAPLLEGALAAIDCTVEEVIERQSHAIVIGRIEAVDLGRWSDPLLYWSGVYRTIRDLETVPFSAVG
jgi:flavin reductase (DIM6/NTAB) family NADH-FMN oxidoreductase RutF